MVVPFLSLARVTLLLGPLSVQAQSTPQSVPGLLDACGEEWAEYPALSCQLEMVISRGPYAYCNQVYSTYIAEGGYDAAAEDVLTFRYNTDTNVYLLATEDSYWDSRDSVGSGALVGSQTTNTAVSPHYAVKLRNVYQACCIAVVGLLLLLARLCVLLFDTTTSTMRFPGGSYQKAQCACCSKFCGQV